MYHPFPAVLDQNWSQTLGSQFLVHTQKVDLSHINLLLKDLTTVNNPGNPPFMASWPEITKGKSEHVQRKKNPANFFTKETKIRTNFRQNLQWENPNKSQQKNIFWGNKLAFPAKSATFRAWICAGIPVIKPTSLGVLDVWKMPGDVTGAGAFRIPTWKNLPKNLPAASQCVFLTDESCFFFQFLGDSPEKI